MVIKTFFFEENEIGNEMYQVLIKDFPYFLFLLPASHQ